jgi:hypothetical protein
MVVADWLDQHTSQAPRALRARVRQYALLASGASLPHLLASAGQTALDQALSHPGDRAAALDLLAADALITLALLAQAEINTDRLDEFATLVLQAPRALS